MTTTAKMPTELTGTVIRPDDPAYATARLCLLSAMFPYYPAVIVYALCVRDIQNAILWAREHDMLIRIRTGGNDIMGWSSANSVILIDISRMTKIAIDTRHRVLRAEAGVLQGDLLNALSTTGYFTALGDEGILGFVSVFLGGGIGTLSRIKGPGCDSLVALETVLADGQVIKADAHRNSDLFWASRGGGGGNFGIVSSYALRLYKAPPVVTTFNASWPDTSFIPAYDTWQRWARRQGKKVGSKTTFLGSLVFQLKGVFLGPQSEMGNLLAPLLAVPGGTWVVTEEPFSSFFRNVPTVEQPFQHYTSGWVRRPISLRNLNVILQFMRVAPSPESTFFSLSWGLRTRRVPKGGSAFPRSHRCAMMYTEASCEFSDSSIVGQALGWNARFRQAMRRFSFGAYVNVQQIEVENWGKAYYGRKNYRRLQEIKSKYDPQNVFSFEQSIRPCVGKADEEKGDEGCAKTEELCSSSRE